MPHSSTQLIIINQCLFISINIFGRKCDTSILFTVKLFFRYNMVVNQQLFFKNKMLLENDNFKILKGHLEDKSEKQNK